MRVYLSPHYDDICFSIGNLACRFRGNLVNLFTLSSYVAVDMELPADVRERVEVVTRLRHQEDRFFSDAARLARHDLGLCDAPLLGHRHSDLTSLRGEVAALLARLMPYIHAVMPNEGNPRTAALYCPMGIGGHRNHLSTLLAVRRAYDTLRRHCTVFLYEDLPYASDPRARRDGLQRANQLFAGTLFTPIILPINSDYTTRKMQLISLYASQHAHVPRIVDFTPASGFAPGFHEIIWKVSPSIGDKKWRSQQRASTQFHR